MIDFSIPSELEATRQRVIAFMDQFVYPNENKLIEDEGLPADLEERLANKGEDARSFGHPICRPSAAGWESVS